MSHDDRPIPGNVTKMEPYREFRAQAPHTVPTQVGVGSIHSVKPRAYGDARMIGEAYRKGIPVILTLTEIPEAEAKRLIDFSAGLSFGLAGKIEKVTTDVFILTPANVQVESDSDIAGAERGFYNQG